MNSSAVRFLVSAASAAGLTYAAYVALPDSLDVRTDIVGFPAFANFNINYYFWQYGLVVVVLPLATIGFYIALTRVFVGRLGPWRPLPEPCHQLEVIPETVGWREWAVAAGRTLLVGGVLGLEVAIVVEQASEVVLTTMFAYAAGVVVAGWLGARLVDGDRFVAMSVVNTLATPFLIAGLWAVSRATGITVTSSGDVHGYPWLPAWLAFGAVAVLLAYFAVRARRAPTHAARGSLERCAVLLVAAPIGLFVFTAALPGELGTLDSFEDGQALVAGDLVGAGAFPWRDILISHGLLFDVGRGLFGSSIFDDSRWGLVAGDGVLLLPLAWVVLYYLCAYLFWTNWLYLLGTQLLIVCGHIAAIQTRMILVPIAFLLLGVLLARSTLLLAAAFTAVMLVQIVVTPEALVVGAASLATLVVFEFLYHERGRALTAAYARTIRCVAVGAVILLGWAVFLAAYRALDDWAFSFAATIPGHRLTGGIESFVPKTEFDVVAPIALVLLVWVFMAFGLRSRLTFVYQDWVMVAMAGYTLLYFTKFLSRADSGHLEQSVAAAVPLLFYVAFRGITFVEARLARLAHIWNVRWFPRRHTVTLPVLAALLVAAPEPLHDAIRAAPGHFRAVAGGEPEIARVGYARPGENDPEVLRGLEDELGSLLDPGDTVFDFANAPGVTYYLLEQRLGTPYYHVSYAIRQRTQSDLLDRLRADPPTAVVLTSAGAGSQGFNSLPTWDGIVNAVRHYDISEYLLDHYVPVRDVRGFVVMARRDTGARVNPDLYFHHDACNWGYVPNFFTPAPAASATSVSLPFRRLEPMGASGRTEYAVTIPGDAADYRWLEIRTGDALREGDFQLADRRGLVPHDSRVIFFKALDRGETVLRVKIGSCPQWRGYRPGTLYFSTNTPQDIREIRLMERAASAG